MAESFAGRVALVTGANRGIGLGVVRQLARLGFDVILGSRHAAKGERASVARRFGKLDVLVNNAGALYDDWQRAENADLQTAREAFETNTLGAWRVSIAFIPLLKKSRHARIVNVSSESGSLAVMGGGSSRRRTDRRLLPRRQAARLVRASRQRASS